MSAAKNSIDRSKPLAGRTAIITGSGQNIGRAIALLFAQAGANIVVNGLRNQTSVDSVVKEVEKIGTKAMGCLADVADPDAVAAMVKKAEDKCGAIDIAVSNVSIRLHKPFYDITIEDWERTLKSNLSAAFYLARLVLPGMQKRKWGRFIHISGEDGFMGHIPNRAHNTVCKAGVHAFAKAISIEFAADGVTANTVSPGPIDTVRNWNQYPKGWVEMRKAQIPMRRLGHVDDIAEACLYLAGDSGSFVTGQVLHLNGGMFMY